jgi:CheY-like chemotaxis protein
MSGRRMLVIEDNPIDAMVFLNYVKKLGWETHHADSLGAARDVVTRMGRDAFDLVVVDLSLPDAAGLEVVEFARREVRRAATVILTGETEMSMAAAALRHGASDYLVKGSLRGDNVERVLTLALLRQEMAVQAEQSEANLRGVLASMNDALFVLDADGQVLFRNPRAETLHVRFREQGTGTWLQIVPGVREQTSVDRRAGDTVAVEVRSGPIRWAGTSATLVVVRDMTAERSVQQAQANLREKEELAQVGDEAYKDWHDVKNKLTAIQGIILQVRDRLAGEPADPSDPDPLGTLSKVVGEINLIAERYRRGAVERRNLFEVTDVAALVDLRCTAFRAGLPDPGKLKVRLVAVPPVFGDQHALSNAIENLLTNANKALLRRPDGGREGEIVVSTAVEGQEVVLRVADNGPGFGQGDPKRFFAKGAGADPTGTGLGLTSVREAVAKFKGEVQIQSSPQGATIVVRLPVHVERTRPAREGKLSVLVVEDNEFAGRAAQRILRGTFDVTLASDGLVAVELIEEGLQVDAILCDLEMPNLDGPGFYEVLRERWPELLPRMAFCSGGASSPEMIRFLKEASTPMLSKPFKPEEAMVLIERLADA